MSTTLVASAGQVETAEKSRAPSSLAPPPWWKIVTAEQSLWAAGKGSERLQVYRREAGLGSGDWCSVFINWVMKQAGYSGTHSASARSWTKWGAALGAPRLGAVAVLSDGIVNDAQQPNNPWFHVTFYNGPVSGGIQCIGGNQDHQVKLKTYYFTDTPLRIHVYAVSYRWPGMAGPAPGGLSTI